jgi:hemerythrin-like domain-containing protein
MQRFNAFLLIHKALRAVLYDAAITLQHTDFATATNPQSLENLSYVLEAFDSHAGHEDKHLFCLLESCNPQLMYEMEGEHVTDHKLTSSLRSLIAEYKNATTPADKARIGATICYTFNDFIAFNLTHLNKEELIVNEALWNNYTDMDIIQANQRLVAAIPPPEMQFAINWMMRSCSNNELISWVNAIKANIPPQALQMLMNVAEEVLPAERFEHIQNGIMEVA